MVRKIALLISVLVIVAAVLPLQVSAATIHSISGTVLVNGKPLNGVLVYVKGTKLSATTNSLGIYVINNVPNGSSGKVKAALANFTFLPANRLFNNLRTNLGGQNFSATQIHIPTYSLSGLITNGSAGLPGVLLTFGSMTTTSLGDGSYSFSNIPAGTSGRIQPKLADFGFSPVNIAVSAMGADLTNQNFSAFVAYTISGSVTQTGTGLPMAGVTVTLGSYSDVTNAAGEYNITGILPGTSGTLTPSLAGKTFTPPSIAIPPMAADVHSRDFVAAP